MPVLALAADPAVAPLTPVTVVAHDPAVLLTSPVKAGRRAQARLPLEMFVALVASVVADAARPEISAAAGCAVVSDPAVERPVTNWWLVAVSEETPPSEETAGVGKRAAGKVPVLMFAALVASTVADAASPLTSEATGCAKVGAPVRSIPVMN